MSPEAMGALGMVEDAAYSEKETERRREAALAKMLATPPKPHAKQKPSPRKRKAKKAPK